MNELLEQLLAFVRFDAVDRANLAGLQARIASELPAIAERFYADAEAHPGAAALLAEPAVVERLRLTLVELALMLRQYQLDSEHKLIERERRIQAERIAAIQTLSAGLAHEVRNPLNAAKLQLELLERRLQRDGADPRLLEPIELVDHELARLTRMLGEFLAFARPPELCLGAHDVVTIALEVIEAETAKTASDSVAIAMVADGPIVATIDPSKLQQILHHLIRNATEAVPHGGHVTVTIRSDAMRVIIEVADDGPGIPDAVRARVYEPFFSTKPDGTGLGMSIVHSMVTLHGGTILIDSSPRGTRCEVSLPLTPS